MTASTVSGAYFSDRSYPRVCLSNQTVFLTESIAVATTSLDEAGDRVKFFPVPDSHEIFFLAVTNDDLDSGGGALDMDVVLVDDNGDTILYNAGTAFNAAVSTPVIRLLETEIVSAGETAYVGLLVNTAASTAASGAVRLTIGYHPRV